MKTKITDEELEELLKTKSPKRILGMYCNLKITLSSKQINKLIKMKEV